MQKAKRRLLKASIGQVSNMRRAALHLAEYLESNEMSETCSKVVAADTLIDSLEEYDDSARAKAKARAAKRAAKNLPPRRNDRGGATATMPIFRAGLACDGLYPDPPRECVRLGAMGDLKPSRTAMEGVRVWDH